MYFNSSTSLLKKQLYPNYAQSNGNRFYDSTQSSADEQEIDDKNSKIRPDVPLHNCLNQLEKCTFENCALNIFDNVVVKEELIIDDYEDSKSVIENYFYDSFEKWSEFGQPLKTFLQNSNFNFHVEENYLGDKMLDDTISNNSSYDDSSNSVGGSIDKTIVIRNQEWALEKVFKSETLATSYLDERNWSLRVRYSTKCGIKSLYRCNLGKNKKAPCAAKVSMEYNNSSKSFLVYNNRLKHTHGTILHKSSSDRDVRQKVRELVDLGLSKYEIQLHLENNGFNLPSDAIVNGSGRESESIAEKPIEIKPKMELCSKVDSSTFRQWKLEKKFVNSRFALRYMKDTGIWVICSKKRGVKQDKQYYRCNRVRKAGPQCAAQKYLLIDHTTGGATLFGVNEHTHNLILSMKADESSDGSGNHNFAIKKESESDCDNGDKYEYYGYDTDERKVEGTSDSIRSNDINDENLNDRLSPLSSDANKNNDHYWILNRTFKTGAMAKMYLDECKTWKLKHRQVNGIGLKCIYRCGLTEATKLSCAAMAYAQFHAKNDKVFFYTNSVDHTHMSINKNDSDKNVDNKCLPNNPENNELNHIKNDDVTRETKSDTIIEKLRDRHSLRSIKTETQAPVVVTTPKPTDTELLEYIPPKRRVLPWQLEKSFDTLNDAHIYMKNKPNWYMWKKQNFKYGGSSKSYYKCMTRVDNIHCLAQKHLFVDTANDTITISRYHEHCHEPVSPVPSPIPFAISEVLTTSTDDNNATAVDDNDTVIDVVKDTVNESVNDSVSDSVNDIVKDTVEDTVDDSANDNEVSTLTDTSNTNSRQVSCSTKGTWGNNWELKRKFKNMPEAVRYMKNKTIWSICGKLKVSSGYRQYYRCNLVKKSGPQCDARKYLFFNTPKKEVLLYGCNSHTHDLILAATEDVEEQENEEKRTTTNDDTRYVFERKFKNLDYAIAYIKEANTWTHHSTLKSRTGERQYFLCRLRGNRKRPLLKCPARCCLKSKLGKQEVTLFNRASSHTHQVPYKPSMNRSRPIKRKRKGRPKKVYTVKKSSNKETNNSTRQAGVPQPSKPEPSNSIREFNTWYLERNFINSTSALKYMKKEKIWSIFSKRRSNNGNDIQYYRCNEVKKSNVHQCAAQKYLVFHSKQAKVALYGRNEHTHEAILAGKDPDEIIEEEEPEKEAEEEAEEEEKEEEIGSTEATTNDDTIAIDATAETENTTDEAYDEPLNENLYAVDVVIEEVDESTTATKYHVRGRGLGKNYILEKKFRNAKTALQYIKSQKIWSISFNGKTSKGYRQRFRCNLVNRKGPQCDARKYLVCDSTKKFVQVFNSITEHTHEAILSAPPNEDDIENKSSSIPPKRGRPFKKRDELSATPKVSTKIDGKRPRQSWKRKMYSLEKKFKNAQSAINYMKTQKEWSVHSRTKRDYEMKQYYRCNYVKVGGPQCQAGKFLLYSELKKEVSLFHCNNHTHDSILQNYSVNEGDNNNTTTTELGEDEDNNVIESETTVKNDDETDVAADD